MLNVRIDRHRCIGAGNCVTLAPTAFGWLPGDMAKVGLMDPSTVDEEPLRAAVLSCPTAAIILEQVETLMPWQLRQVAAREPRRVQKTFMFTDIVQSTRLVEALGDEAWESLLSWHDQALRSLFSAHNGEEVVTTGDGFFVGFDSPADAIECAIAIQRRLAEQRKMQGFAPQVRIGVHASEATQAGRDFKGKGVHEAARIGALAEAGEILASQETAAATRAVFSEPTQVTLKGLSEPVSVVSIEWR